VKTCLKLFFTFFKVSMFTLGGGLAMLPLIQREVVDRKKWLGEGEFLDIIAISNSLPGSIAVNVATPIGYKLRGRWGALFAAFGAIVPPFVVIILVATVFLGIRDEPAARAVFKGLRPCVVALIAIPVITLSRAAGINKKTILIPVAVLLGVVLLKVHPMYIVLLAVLCALARVSHRKRGESQ
jgi:chromate transporter